MTEEENLRLIEERDRAFSKDWDRFIDVHADSVVVYAPGLEEPIRGKEAAAQFFHAFASAFPDAEPEVLRSFAQGEWVCSEEVFTGTHTGPLQTPDYTIPATQRTIRVPSLRTFRIEGGKVAELHIYFDNMTFMAQLGVGPEGGA